MSIGDWLNARTGYRAGLRRLLDEPIPGDVNWWFTLGSVLLFLLALQFITGVTLTMYYVPTPASAYDSVRYISTQLTFGHIVRALHFFGASFIVIFAVLHLLRVLFFGAYKSPREVTWGTGIILLLLVLAFGLTGYLLPWDQRAYWATVVTINIAKSTPVVGPYHRGDHARRSGNRRADAEPLVRDARDSAARRRAAVRRHAPVSDAASRHRRSFPSARGAVQPVLSGARGEGHDRHRGGVRAAVLTRRVREGAARGDGESGGCDLHAAAGMVFPGIVSDAEIFPGKAGAGRRDRHSDPGDRAAVPAAVSRSPPGARPARPAPRIGRRHAGHRRREHADVARVPRHAERDGSRRSGARARSPDRTSRKRSDVRGAMRPAAPDRIWHAAASRGTISGSPDTSPIRR